MDKICAFCRENVCPYEHDMLENDGCILNLIIYEDENKVLFYNLSEKRIFIIRAKDGLKEIDFQEAIREIDIIPVKKPEWKRLQILKLAKELGFFGLA